MRLSSSISAATAGPTRRSKGTSSGSASGNPAPNRHTEASRIGRESYVAQRSDFESATDAYALDRGNQRNRATVYRGQRVAIVSR